MSVDKTGVLAAEDVESLDPATIEAYLRDHPGFLRNRPDLLTQLQLPHGGEGAVSLVERQVALLRERNIDMRKRMATLVENADLNETLFNATRALVLALLEAESLAAVDSIFRTNLREAFKVQMSNLLWLPAASAQISDITPVSAATAELLSGLVRHGKPLCGVLRGEEMGALFGTGTIEGSAAVAPLKLNDELIGIVAVGDRNVGRYQASDGTLFLDYVAEVIERLIRREAGAAQ